MDASKLRSEGRKQEKERRDQLEHDVRPFSCCPRDNRVGSKWRLNRCLESLFIGDYCQVPKETKLAVVTDNKGSHCGWVFTLGNMRVPRLPTKLDTCPSYEAVYGQNNRCNVMRHQYLPV